MVPCVVSLVVSRVLPGVLRWCGLCSVCVALVWSVQQNYSRSTHALLAVMRLSTSNADFSALINGIVHAAYVWGRLLLWPCLVAMPCC